MTKGKKQTMGMARLWWRVLWRDEEIKRIDDMNEYDEDYRYEITEKEEEDGKSSVGRQGNNT